MLLGLGLCLEVNVIVFSQKLAKGIEAASRAEEPEIRQPILPIHAVVAYRIISEATGRPPALQKDRYSARQSATGV
jgi:hypothetical protein